jgi:hypothetical protein
MLRRSFIIAMRPILTSITLLTLALLLSCVDARAEELRFRTFPRKVERFGCSVEQVTLSIRMGDEKGALVYTAEAWATKVGEKDRWEQVIARFEATPKGRRKALKECADWMDAAEAIIKKEGK